LKDPCTPSEQARKQKVMKLCTDQSSQSKNSLRIGWYYDPDTDFYAHINQNRNKGVSFQ
jgi:hypothetical protein